MGKQGHSNNARAPKRSRARDTSTEADWNRCSAPAQRPAAQAAELAEAEVAHSSNQSVRTCHGEGLATHSEKRPAAVEASPLSFAVAAYIGLVKWVVGCLP
eukprot:5940757-Amphidinium_carterae.1